MGDPSSGQRALVAREQHHVVLADLDEWASPGQRREQADRAGHARSHLYTRDGTIDGARDPNKVGGAHNSCYHAKEG
jgi:hypothetical protein